MKFLVVLVALLLLKLTVGQDVIPEKITAVLAPGESATFDVSILTKSDVGGGSGAKLQLYILADTTGSMGSVLTSIQMNAKQLVESVLSDFPATQFAAGYYRDFPFDPEAFVPQSDFQSAGTTDEVLASIDAWSARGGGDGPEGQLWALDQIAEGKGISWDPSAFKLIVWFGDAPGHDPVCKEISGAAYDVTEASVLAKLKAKKLTGWLSSCFSHLERDRTLTTLDTEQFKIAFSCVHQLFPSVPALASH